MANALDNQLKNLLRVNGAEGPVIIIIFYWMEENFNHSLKNLEKWMEV